LILQSDKVAWYISFLPEKSTEKFIQGIFTSQNFEVGDKKSCVRFAVQHVEVLPALICQEESLTFETMSPICISTRDDKMTTKYLSPTDEKARGNIVLGLMHKYEAFYRKKYEGVINYNFETLNEPKPVLTKIKAGTLEETKVKGYMCKFKIKLPEELMRVMYEGGIGEKGSLGFGMVKAKPF
jgi:CRISPR-associated endoribonuclease Cas6